MHVPRISCHISSRTGAMIVGGLSFIGSLIGIITEGIELAESYTEYSESTDMDFEDYLHDVYMIILYLANAVSSSFMMYGANKGRRAFMFPWLSTFITITAMTICYCLAIVLSYLVSCNLRRDLCDFASAFGASLTIATFEILLCTVVYNHYKQLISRNSIHPYTVSGEVIKSPISYEKV